MRMNRLERCYRNTNKAGAVFKVCRGEEYGEEEWTGKGVQIEDRINWHFSDFFRCLINTKEEISPTIHTHPFTPHLYLHSPLTPHAHHTHTTRTPHAHHTHTTRTPHTPHHTHHTTPHTHHTHTHTHTTPHTHTTHHTPHTTHHTRHTRQHTIINTLSGVGVCVVHGVWCVV
jgi:hypothetical protein